MYMDLSDTKWNNKNFHFKKLYKREELPPHYPNGWFSVLESRDLRVNQIKPISAFGVDLVVYRELTGKVHVLDAYCPHLGANLGIGGRVVGDSVRCPFHGWTFNGKGVCTQVPGLECMSSHVMLNNQCIQQLFVLHLTKGSNLPKVQIKVWECVEENGFIFVWHHSDQQKPDWFPIPIPEVRDSKLVYRGRAEHIVKCHLQFYFYSVRCPFHGWTFNGKGVCTQVPGLECSNLPKVQIKVWECVEENGFIFVWHHSDQQKPDWFPIPIPEVRDSKLVYRGRAEHIVKCHLQEIPENGADVMHLNELHEGPEFLGTVVNRSKFYQFFIKFLRYDWRANWQPCPAPDKHIAHLDLRSVYSLFGFPLMPFSLDVLQIGPANVHLKINIKFLGEINGYIIQTITPLAPLKNKIVHHFYTEPTFKALIFSKFMIYGEARMVERDIVIWNNKKFLKQPYFAKHETPLVKFRRWFSQFYTEKYPKEEDW
ncbi:unnamed protein product [Oppiella nova]|uniref:cholesterol 7-desaturase n=1 Tax=Oppiella nova TaxID=334625 RepID=A0A7R9LRA4_9ACAR|nr:unnamed protein product [Oppiella nova]CAG2165831.1 unnamed protein product [Oppiella nova]